VLRRPVDPPIRSRTFEPPLNLAVVARDPDTQVHRFARIKVPPLFARWVALPGGAGFVPAQRRTDYSLVRVFDGLTREEPS
jgi:polyphosphate kinase